MFAANSLGSIPPHLLAALMAQSSLAPGGGSFPSQPANPNAGGQGLPQPQPRPSVGMFAGGAPRSGPLGDPQPPGVSSQPRYGGGPMGNPAGALSLNGGGMSPNNGGIMSNADDQPSVLNQGPLGPDQFTLGRDMANLSHVDPIKAKHGPNWQKIGGVLQAGIAGYLAAQGNPAGMAMLNNNFAMQRDRAEYDQRLREIQAKRFEPASVGGSLVQLQPDGSYKTLYDAPQAFEKFAGALGYQPGTPEYQAAVQDYRLGSWSDPAMENRLGLEGVRYGNRDALQDQRLDVTRRGQDLNHRDRQASIGQSNTNNIRSTSTSTANNTRSTATSTANSIRSADTTRGAYSYSHGGKRGGGAASGEGQVIVNPTTGQRMQLKGGQWVAIK